MPFVEKTCDRCGNSFVADDSNPGLEQNRFCSAACMSEGAAQEVEPKQKARILMLEIEPVSSPPVYQRGYSWQELAENIFSPERFGDLVGNHEISGVQFLDFKEEVRDITAGPYAEAPDVPPPFFDLYNEIWRRFHVSDEEKAISLMSDDLRSIMEQCYKWINPEPF